MMFDDTRQQGGFPRMPRWAVGAGLMGVLLWAATGCVTSYAPDERSGADAHRAGAQAIPLSAPVTDGVNYEGGDATDWKSFEAPGAGPITIEVYFDNPYIHADVGLYDAYGVELTRQSRGAGTQPIIITHNLPEAETYFVRIRALENRSVYSVRVSPGTPEAGQEVVDPRPEFDRPI